MLNKVIISVVVLCGCQMLMSCQNNERQELKEKKEFWGEVDYFDDFLWSEYESEILEKTICIELNKEACKTIKSLEFGVYELNSSGKYIAVDTDVAQFYINGEECNNNEFEVRLKEHSEINLGVELDDDAQNGTLTYYLKILDSDVSLDRVNDLVVDRGDVIPATFELKVIKSDNINTLKAGAVTTGMILLIAFLLWMLMFRYILYPRFKITNITFDGQDYNQEVYFVAKARGAYKIVFSTKTHKQNIFSKILKGKVQYISNPFFSDGEMEAAPASNKSIKFKPGRADYIIEPGNTLNRNNQDSTISNSTSKVGISIL